MAMEPPVGSATKLAAEIRRGEVSPVEVVERSLSRIDERDGDVGAFVTVLEDRARERAREAERAVAEGEPLGPLHGVPVAIKDLDPIAGVRTTFGSASLADHVPDETATYVERLEAAGVIVVGKTNTPEFGHKGTTDNAIVGPTSTPFDLDRNAGGSSGGAAAAVADGMVPVAQGTDGGGSIRIPAAWCGVVGVKPTYGRVASAARPDAFLTHTPFVHAGPIARTVEDAALLLEPMCGPHPRDPLSVPDDDLGLQGAARRGIEGFRIAYSPALDVFPVDDRVRAVVDDAVEAFVDAGASVDRVEVGIEHDHDDLADVWLRQIGGLYHSQMQGFADAGIDLLAEHRDELAPEFVDLLDATRQLTVPDAKRDERLRTTVYDAIANVLETHDLLVTPTLAVPPVENAPPGERTLGPETVDGEPVDPRIGWCLTYPINFTGHPAASVPAGLTDGGLPVGMQVVGRRFSDADVLAAAGAIERVRPWHDVLPSA